MNGEIVRYEEAADRCSGVLPGELIVEIIQRLPVKSLVRFMSVSKDWQFIILCPQFIAKHLIYQQHKQKVTSEINYLHTFYHHPHLRSQSSISLISKGDHEDLNDPFSTSVLDGIQDVSIVGSSNGLICVKFNHNKSFGLWNPATRKLKFLPNPVPVPSHQECYDTNHGFMYVPRTGCYKLVLISTRATKLNDDITTFLHIQALNIGETLWREELSHGQWREVSHDQPYFSSTSTVVLNCCLYWLDSFNEGGSLTLKLVWLDMENEVFGEETKLPNRLDDDFTFSVVRRKLTLFEKNLAMIVSDEAHRFEDLETLPLNKSHQVWIYDGTSWKKQLTFGPLPIDHDPMGVWGDREIIMQCLEKNYLYNPYRNETSNYYPCGEKYCSFAFYPYLESLVRI